MAREKHTLPTLWSAPFSALQEALNETFEAFLHHEPGAAHAPAPWSRYVPSISLGETEAALEVTAELPGLDEADVQVVVTADHLTLKGQKKEEKEERKKDWYHAERRFGSFERRIALPCEIDPERTTATFDKGVLEVVLPKVAPGRAAGREVPVRAKA